MKIREFYLDKATYIAVDRNGHKIKLHVNYWENKYKISEASVALNKLAKKMLNKKHKVNFVHKLLE